MASGRLPAAASLPPSPTCLRVDDNAGLALGAIELIFRAIGGYDMKAQTGEVSATLPHPGGARVHMKVVAYHVTDGGQTYLDVQRCTGDALFGGRIYGLLNESLAAFKMPPCFQTGQLALPLPPGLRHAEDPMAVPPMSLTEELAWSTVDGIAEWSPRSIHHFKVDHEQVMLWYQQGKLDPKIFEAHFQKMPAAVRQGLKLRKTWKTRLPGNCGDILEKISMLVAEGEMYHALHQGLP